MKQLFLDKQIIADSLHRAFANFGETNVQPEYRTTRIVAVGRWRTVAVKEAGNL